MKKTLSVWLALVLMISVLTVPSFADSSYTVKSGDVLWKIASDHGTTAQTLADYNKMANPNLIYPGDIIRIPDGKPLADSTQPTEQDNAAMANTQLVTILHTNDVHGFFKEGKYDGMGLAKVKTYYDSVLAENPATFLFDGGDALQGNNLVTVSDGEAGTRILNTVGYDAMVAGNHEFDYGAAQTLKLAGMLNFPMLSANVTKVDGSEFLRSDAIVEKDGIKIGLFGLTTPETTYKSHPDNTKDLVFKSITDTAAQYVEKLKTEDVDLIVCLAHLGEEGDYTSALVAENVDGIDVIVDGHSHTIENLMVNNTLIVQSGEKSKNVGRVDIQLEDGQVIEKTATLFTKDMAAQLAEDAAVVAQIGEVEALNAPILDKVIATSTVTLDGEREVVRVGQSNLGNLIVESLLDISQADIALTNGGGIRASLPAGDITVGDVLTVLPFGNTVRVIELTGADFKAALENGFSTYPEALGGFPHIAGATAQFDASKPAGERVTEVTVGGEALDLTKTYTLVTNDFLVAGGDDYTMFEDKKVVAEFGAMDEVLIDFVNAHGFDKAVVDERIVEVSAQ